MNDDEKDFEYYAGAVIFYLVIFVCGLFINFGTAVTGVVVVWLFSKLFVRK